jgi:hypothetical protein
MPVNITSQGRRHPPSSTKANAPQGAEAIVTITWGAKINRGNVKRETEIDEKAKFEPSEKISM